MSRTAERRGSMRSASVVETRNDTVVLHPRRIMYPARRTRRGTLIISDHSVGAKFYSCVAVLVPVVVIPAAMWGLPSSRTALVISAAVGIVGFWLAIGGGAWLAQNVSKRQWVVDPSKERIAVGGQLNYARMESSFPLSELSIIEIPVRMLGDTHIENAVFLGSRSAHPDLWILLAVLPSNDYWISPSLQVLGSDLFGMHRRAQRKTIAKLEEVLGSSLPTVQAEGQLAFEPMPGGRRGVFVLFARALGSTVR